MGGKYLRIYNATYKGVGWTRWVVKINHHRGRKRVADLIRGSFCGSGVIRFADSQGNTPKAPMHQIGLSAALSQLMEKREELLTDLREEIPFPMALNEILLFFWGGGRERESKRSCPLSRISVLRWYSSVKVDVLMSKAQNQFAIVYVHLVPNWIILIVSCVCCSTRQVTSFYRLI